MKKIKGITLISLVITIVVLLILAGVAISIGVDEESVLEKTELAKYNHESARLKEDVTLVMANKEPTKSIQENLKQIQDIKVEQIQDDVYYVKRNEYTTTVYEDGDIIEGAVDIWDGTTSEVPVLDDDLNWNIHNGAQLKFLADFVNNGNALTEFQKELVAAKGYNESDMVITDTTTVYLRNNLDLGARHENGELISGKQWTKIGAAVNEDATDYFNGIFEGNGYCVKGLYIQATNDLGLFGVATNEIRNLTIKDGYVEGTSYVGAVAAYISGTVINCHNVNTTIKGTIAVGGIAGRH